MYLACICEDGCTSEYKQGLRPKSLWKICFRIAWNPVTEIHYVLHLLLLLLVFSSSLVLQCRPWVVFLESDLFIASDLHTNPTCSSFITCLHSRRGKNSNSTAQDSGGNKFYHKPCNTLLFHVNSVRARRCSSATIIGHLVVSANLISPDVPLVAVSILCLNSWLFHTLN